MKKPNPNASASSLPALDTCGTRSWLGTNGTLHVAQVYTHLLAQILLQSTFQLAIAVPKRGTDACRCTQTYSDHFCAPDWPSMPWWHRHAYKGTCTQAHLENELS